MHDSGISIWFFIGVLLTIYGVMVFGYGVYQLASGIYPAGVQLTSLHTPVWWGGALLIVGVIYLVKFRPRRAS